MLNGLAEITAWLGLFITGVWTAYRTHKQEMKIDKAARASEMAAIELTPNHGSSSKDALQRIELSLQEQVLEGRHQSQQIKYQSDMVKSLSHQLGEHIQTTNTQLASHDASINDIRVRINRLEN